MTIMAAASTMWLTGAATFAVTVGLVWLEWQRKDRRHRAMRMFATVAAAMALALMGMRPAWRNAGTTKASRPVEAIVWNAIAPVSSQESVRKIWRQVSAERRFSLPETVRPWESQPTAIPDLGYIRRHYPEVSNIYLIGDGLLPAEMQTLENCGVTYLPLDAAREAPAVGFLSCPREIPFRTPLVVQGRIDGVASGTSVVVSVEAPDGSVATSPALNGNSKNQAAFEVTAPPLPAPGEYVWKLRVAAPGEAGKVYAAEEFGTSVVDTPSTRVLVLESSPHPDTAALRRWFDGVGGAMTIRTTLGANRYQFSSTHGASKDFTEIDEHLLAAFDLLLVDPVALVTLSPPELAAVKNCLENDGLGVLVTGLPASPPAGITGPASATDNVASSFFLPWKLPPLEAASQEENPPIRLVRPHWRGQMLTTDTRLPADAAEILSLDASLDALVDDGQGHVLVARLQRGRGQIGLTLLRDTRRWLAENEATAFASYWSLVLSKISKPQAERDNGRWSLDAGNGEPLFANEPVMLTWTSSAAVDVPAVVAWGGDSQSRTEVALAQDATDRRRWSGIFRPRSAGWHRMTLPATRAKMDFYVSSEGRWTHLRRMNRKAATERYALLSRGHSENAIHVPRTSSVVATPISMWWWYAILLAGVTFLWGERYVASSGRVSVYPKNAAAR